VDDYVFGGASDPLGVSGGSAITVEAWVKPNILSGVQAIVLENGPFMLELSGNKAQGRIYTGTWTSFAGDITLTANTWHHIVMTYDSSNIKLYVNGVFDKSTAKTGNLAGAGALWFGAWSSGAATPSTQWFNGLIDDVRIYNYARSPKQILQDYNAGLGTYFK
jgi:hypothetical protein